MVFLGRPQHRGGGNFREKISKKIFAKKLSRKIFERKNREKSRKIAKNFSKQGSPLTFANLKSKKCVYRRATGKALANFARTAP